MNSIIDQLPIWYFKFYLIVIQQYSSRNLKTIFLKLDLFYVKLKPILVIFLLIFLEYFSWALFSRKISRLAVFSFSRKTINCAALIKTKRNTRMSKIFFYFSYLFFLTKATYPFLSWTNTSASFSSNKFKMHSEWPMGPFPTAAIIGVTPRLFGWLIWEPYFTRRRQISKCEIICTCLMSINRKNEQITTY